MIEFTGHEKLIYIGQRLSFESYLFKTFRKFIIINIQRSLFMNTSTYKSVFRINHILKSERNKNCHCNYYLKYDFKSSLNKPIFFVMEYKTHNCKDIK